MLQEIREKTQGWIAGTIISIIILSFALWGIHSYFVSGVSTTVASVNGIDISKEQLTVAYDRLRRQMQAQYGSAVTPKDEPTLKERALRSLVDIEILKQASVSQGFLITDQQVDDYLQSMPDFQVDGHFSLDRFQEVLSATLLTTSEFLDLIKTSLQIEQPRLGIMLTAFGLPEESRYTASLVNQVRDISYLPLPINQFLSPAIVVTPAQIQAYYTAHQRDYKTPEEVSIDYLELSLTDLYSKFNPSEPVLKSFYNENINAYTQPMRWELAGILVPNAPSADQADAQQSKILNIKQALDQNPASFDKLLKQNAKASLPTGLVALNQLPSDVQKAVMGLTQANQISDPVETAQGLVVIKALAVQEPKINSYDTVKAKVREAYIHQHAEDKFAELRDQLADLTYEHPDSLSVAAKALNLPVKSSALFARDKAGSDIAQFKKVRDAAFSNDVLNLQTNSDVISLNPETVVVLRVKSHLPSSLLPVKDVAQQITDKLKVQAAEARANEFAHTLLSNFQSGTDNTKLINQYQLHWTKVGVMGRYATKVDSAVLDGAFRLPRPAKGKLTYGVTRLPNGYAIVSVSGVQDGVLSTPKQAAVFTEQVQNSLGYLEYSLYRESAVKRANVKFS
jgi:peptidyl-prolyl cis-trans isomerase D